MPAQPDHWRRISHLYHEARERDGSDRAAYLDEACAGDAALRREVESLFRYGSDDRVLELGEPASGDAPGKLAGQMLGAYKLRGLLGAGGMGEVYEAYDPRLKREVAVKVVSSARSGHPERLRRLEREARAAAALNHPNILAVYDIGTHNDVPFIVMERVRGQTLAERIAAARLPISTAIDISIEIADALAAAHANGVLHRDLKPGNVMVTPEGRAKVLDFGLAKVLAPDEPDPDATTDSQLVTRPGQVFGTPAYMAPEQLAGRAVDHRADIFSLGVILFELATGRRPFASGNFVAIALDRIIRPTPNPSDVDRSLPPALSGLITRCLAPEPADRPQAAAELKRELEAIRAELPVAGQERRRSALLRRTRSHLQARPAVRLVIWLTAAVVAVTLTIAAIGQWRMPVKVVPSSRPVIAVLPLENLTGDAANNYLGVGIADALTTSLSRLAAVTVIPRETAREAARGLSEPTRLARQLGVTLLVQGSLQRSGDRVRVDANLIREDGTIAWAGDAEGPASDLLAVQRELADRLVDALRVDVSGSERRNLSQSPTANQEALEAYWRGMALLEGTDAASTDEAIATFERAIAADPKFSLAHAQLGAAFVRKYRATNDRTWMTRAADAVNRALSLDPSQNQVRLSLADLYRTTGRNASAIEELRRILDENPHSDEARRRLGMILDSEGRQDEALQHFRAAVAERPQYWVNHEQLGLFYYRTGRVQDAARAFVRVTQLRPDSALAFMRVGVTYQALGDFDRARETYERALQIDPNEAAVHSNLGMIAYVQGRYEEAARSVGEAVRLRPNRALYRRNLGDVYARLGRNREARAEYEEAIRLTADTLAVNPNDALTMGQLAVYEAKVGRRADAERHIAQAMLINPVPEVLFRLAAVSALHGDATAALQALTDAIGKGYPLEAVRDDPDFAALHTIPEFQALLLRK